MKETVAKYVVTKKRGKGGKVYGSPRIYLPTKLTSDSSFPLRGDLVRVHIKIRGRGLLIEKASRRVLRKFGALWTPEENLTKAKRRTRARD